MAVGPKATTGGNDRPNDESIAQTGTGLPDDSSRLPEDGEQADGKAGLKIEGRMPGEQGRTGSVVSRSNPDQVPTGTPGAGENVCRRCSGTGKLGNRTCPDCSGTGKVTVPIGGA